MNKIIRQVRVAKEKISIIEVYCHQNFLKNKEKIKMDNIQQIADAVLSGL